MNQQQRVESLDSLRAERMSEDEMREVLALWAARHQHPPSDLPTTADMAEGLDIPVDEARRMLHEVRERRREQERLEAEAREAAREEEETEAQAALAEARARLAEAEARRAEAEARKIRAGQQPPQAIIEELNPPENTWQTVAKVISLIIAFLWLMFIFSKIGQSPGSPFGRSPSSEWRGEPLNPGWVEIYEKNGKVIERIPVEKTPLAPR